MYQRAPTEVVEEIRNQVVMTALRGLSVRLGSIREGRKSIIYVSEGLEAMLPPQMRSADASTGKLGNPQAFNPLAGENDPREIVVDASATSFTYEADAFGNALLSGKRQAPAPAIRWDDSLGNIRTLDQWREQVGLVYESETPSKFRKTTLRGYGTSVPLSSTMKHASIPHLQKPVSRLIMGVDNQNTFPHAAIMFDDFFERGGNTFDTAYVYGPKRETLLGEWIRLRGVREQVVVIVKGAHTPFCEPRFRGKQR